jgi:hypothetical protein
MFIGFAQKNRNYSSKELIPENMGGDPGYRTCHLPFTDR